jgi:hypothetical protein
MTVDEIECIEEGGTEPTIALLRHLAAALDTDVRLTAGHDLGSVWFAGIALDPCLSGGSVSPVSRLPRMLRPASRSCRRFVWASGRGT